MANVLFICHGNVGRSQMAEAFYNHLTSSKDAMSAGTDPTTPARYKRPNQEVIDVMKEEGIDVSNNKIKTITKEMVNIADKIYVMCDKNLCPEFLLNSKKTEFLDVEDTFRKNIDETRKIRESIKEKIVNIIHQK